MVAFVQAGAGSALLGCVDAKVDEQCVNAGVGLLSVGPLRRAAMAVESLKRVTREKATAVIGQSLRAGLTKRGEQGNRAWQAIAEMPESDQRAALDSLVDDLEKAGFALYRFASIAPDGKGAYRADTVLERVKQPSRN